MLQITQTAMDVLRQVRDRSDAPDQAAARFELSAAGDQQSIGITFAEGQVESDQKVADDGELQVYVAQELAAPLDNAVVDATTTERGTELVLRAPEAPGS